MSLLDLRKKPKVIHRVAGLDLSTHSMAFSIFENKELVKYGEVQFRGSDVFERLRMAQRLIACMPDLIDVDKIVFEGAVYVQNKKTVILLAYAYGAIVSALAKRGVEIAEVTPTSWQNAIGNKILTKAEKDAVKKEFPGKSESWYKSKHREIRKNRTGEWVLEKFGVAPNSDNLSDAIAIGYVGSA